MAETQHTRTSEFWAGLRLAHTPGLGNAGCKRLLKHYGSAERAVQTPLEWVSLGITDRNVADNFRQEKWHAGAWKEWELALRENMAVLPYSDPEYPVRLRHIPNPPLHLYYAGNLRLLRGPCVAIVGSRSCSAPGKGVADSIARELSSQGICVVSGFAWGIDRIAHQSALNGLGGSAAVLGTGLDQVYPARNRELRRAMVNNGLILTAFAPGTQPEAHNFPRRNRIISGLCLGVLVVEAAKQSGSLITAQYALDQGREVFAVPGFPRQPSFAGCNALIKRGAVLTRSAEDILREIGPMLQEWAPRQPESETGSSGDREAGTPVEDLTDAEADLVQAMGTATPLHIDTLTRRLGWSSSRTSQILLGLELKGVVSRQDGMHYMLLR